MNKELIIHIGHFKTGTTALQVFMEENLAFLEANGVDYAPVWRTYAKHSDYAFSIMRAAGVRKLLHGYAKPITPRTMWTQLYEHVMESRFQTTLVSSEEIIRIGQFPKAVDILRDCLEARPAGLRVRALVYLREPGSQVLSWYNQLVKMNYFPIGDINAAATGEIEEIHYDYHRALAPWVEILGPENVTVRPYVRDRADPAALHRDFLSVLGIEMPPALAEQMDDPNPRFDDRVVELVRLMQNMKYPHGTIEALRTQAESYLEVQDALPGAGAVALDEVRAEAQAGLDWIAELPDSAIPVERFAARLPEPAPPLQIERNLVLGFVFSELIQLRQRVNAADLPGMGRRLATLDSRLKALETGRAALPAAAPAAPAEDAAEAAEGSALPLDPAELTARIADLEARLAEKEAESRRLAVFSRRLNRVEMQLGKADPRRGPARDDPAAPEAEAAEAKTADTAAGRWVPPAKRAKQPVKRPPGGKPGPRAARRKTPDTPSST
ncbi:sulfotransferase family protein [Mesobacterium pallidum]|uniref:sulfotransferase family protein n=1 Tax=Mesobacterium pallidum TaxID=2872037 RepID=UPI001EE35641|nr:sulfotransferase family protein [Mesobacterium pallidum]